MDSIDRKQTIEHIQNKLVEAQMNSIGFLAEVYDDLARHLIEPWINEMPSAQSEVTEEAVKEYCRKRCLCIVDSALLKKYASVEPEQKKGKWINSYDLRGNHYKRCSECGAYIEATFFANDYSVNYCPNCGAEMEIK